MEMKTFIKIFLLGIVPFFLMFLYGIIFGFDKLKYLIA
jgi:hypothetical protein